MFFVCLFVFVLFCFSVSAIRFLSLTGYHSPPHLPRMPSNTVLVSDPLCGQLRFKSGLTPVCSCLQFPHLLELACFLLWELLMSFYTFHRHRVCLVDHADLIRSLYSWWEGLGPCSLPTLPLGFNCSFISTFYFFMWVVHWGLLLRLPWWTWVCTSEGQVWR